jgi:hypothetical protein
MLFTWLGSCYRCLLLLCGSLEGVDCCCRVGLILRGVLVALGFVFLMFYKT